MIGLAAQVRTLRLFAAPGKLAPSPAKKARNSSRCLPGAYFFDLAFRGLLAKPLILLVPLA